MIAVSISGLPDGAMTDYSLTYPKCSILFSCLVQLAIATVTDEPLNLALAKRAFSKFVDTFYGARTNSLILKAGIDGAKLDEDYHCTFSLDAYNELLAGNGDNYATIAFSTFDVARTREFVRRVMATYMRGAFIDGELVQDIRHWCFGEERTDTLPFNITDTPFGGQPAADFMLSKYGPEWAAITASSDSGVQVPVTNQPARVLLDFTRSYSWGVNMVRGQHVFVVTSVNVSYTEPYTENLQQLEKVMDAALMHAGVGDGTSMLSLVAVVPATANFTVIDRLLDRGFTVKRVEEVYSDRLPVVLRMSDEHPNQLRLCVSGHSTLSHVVEAGVLNNLDVLHRVADYFDAALWHEQQDGSFSMEDVFNAEATMYLAIPNRLRHMAYLSSQSGYTIV